MSMATNCNTQIKYNNKEITLPHSSEKLHKSFDNYFEREYNLKKYGYAFIEKEVLSDQNGEYLLYDGDDGRFVKDTVACIEGHYSGPDYFNMDWVKRIDIKREKINPNIRPILVLFKCVTLDEKYRMLKSMDDLISKFIKYLEDNSNEVLYHYIF